MRDRSPHLVTSALTACLLIAGLHVAHGRVVNAGDAAPSSEPLPAVTAGSSVSAQTGDGFSIFYAAFKQAVIERDRGAIRGMMAPRFEWALDGYISRDEALKYMDEFKRWGELRKAVLRKPVRCKQPFCNNRPGYRVWSLKTSKSSFPIEVMFERGADGRWRWSALLGD